MAGGVRGHGRKHAHRGGAGGGCRAPLHPRLFFPLFGGGGWAWVFSPFWPFPRAQSAPAGVPPTPTSAQKGAATTGVLGVLGAPTPVPAGSVPADAPVIAVSVNGSSVKSGQTIAVPATPVANTSDAMTVTISNTGGSPLELDKYAPPELYGDGSMMYLIDYTTYSRTIDPGESTSLTVTFFPYQTGSADATLVIISNDPRTPQFEIDLAGKGLPMSVAADTGS